MKVGPRFTLLPVMKCSRNEMLSGCGMFGACKYPCGEQAHRFRVAIRSAHLCFTLTRARDRIEFGLRSCRRVRCQVGSRRAEARRNRSPRCLRGTMLPSSPPPTAAAPPRSCADPSGHRSADHRRGYRPQDSLSIQSTFPSIKRGGGRDDSHPNSLLTGKITGNFEKNANSPCQRWEGRPQQQRGGGKVSPL